MARINNPNRQLDWPKMTVSAPSLSLRTPAGDRAQFSRLTGPDQLRGQGGINSRATMEKLAHWLDRRPTKSEKSQQPISFFCVRRLPGKVWDTYFTRFVSHLLCDWERLRLRDWSLCVWKSDFYGLLSPGTPGTGLKKWNKAQKFALRWPVPGVPGDNKP